MLKYEVSYDVKTFEPFFKPGSVAVIGASAKTGTIGNVILRNFLKHSFRGESVPGQPKIQPYTES